MYPFEEFALCTYLHSCEDIYQYKYVNYLASGMKDMPLKGVSILIALYNMWSLYCACLLFSWHTEDEQETCFLSSLLGNDFTIRWKEKKNITLKVKRCSIMNFFSSNKLSIHWPTLRTQAIRARLFLSNERQQN